MNEAFILKNSQEYNWVRLHTPPKKVRRWNQIHACNSKGYVVPNFEKLSPSRIKYLREQSYKRYKKTEDSKYFDSMRLTGEVGRIEGIRWIER